MSASSDVIELRPMGERVGSYSPPPEPTGFKRFIKSCRQWTQGYVAQMNAYVNQSTFGRVFRLKDSGHPDAIEEANFSTEIRAGLTTFATMAYIIAVNANILADTGGTCECTPYDAKTMSCGNKDEFAKCQEELHQDLITATAAIAAFSCIMLGFMTNLPVCLAPGMGLNAYFTYQVVGVKGQGNVPYRLALTAVFMEGFIFLFLAITGLRHWLVKLIPGTIKTASGVGIGFFLTIIGLSYSAGIGAITGAISTPLTLGGCDASQMDPQTGECTGFEMTSGKMWIGICLSGVLTTLLMAFRVKSAIILGIAIVSIMSWPRSTPFTYFPPTVDGDARFEFFQKVVYFQPIRHTLVQQEWNMLSHSGEFALALFTFLYVDIIDCTATLYSMARFCGRVRDNDGDFPRSTVAYCTDAICIAEGGRTGLTAITCGFCFLISMFFAPIFASIPPWATGCTLILVGCLMVRQVTRINWIYVGDAVPSFVTLALIPFTYSVAYGLIGGIFCYVTLNFSIWFLIRVTGGKITPTDFEKKEYWTWKPAGKQPIIFRAFAKLKFWGRRPEPLDPPGFRLNDQVNDGEFAESAQRYSHNSRGSRGSRASHAASSEEEKISRREPSPHPFREYHK
ncbi:hypothetical protein P8C59_006645 [Phyllachora maydis]|uniref:Uncharacterized protein n=1 Tax=Phyllachora maydis TaxID=1825666 RepID=A0AAD9I796_9PEZI|nr:hypothetical protein P8C59_006645 [Phyllachora maydis]